MLALERRNDILRLIQENQTVLVSDLKKRYGVTDETIRRDLERLEATGAIVRTYGGAMRSDRDMAKIEQPANIRKQINIQEKKMIAEMVAGIVQEGDGIMLDDSSTGLFVARALKSKQKLTLITNSVDVIQETSEQSSWTIMGCGGVLNERSMSFVGNQAEYMLKNYHVHKTILSCKGLDLTNGLTESSEPSALVKRCMIDAAKEVILVADCSKFDVTSFVQIAPLDKVHTIVTEIKPSEVWCDTLKEKGIRCIWPDEM